MEFEIQEATLISAIDAIVLELQTIKEKMYDLCENDKTEVQLKDIPRDADDKHEHKKRKRYTNLRWEELWFYEMIMKVCTNKTQSVIKLCIRTPFNDTYGCQFDLNSASGTYSLARCYLPFSLDPLDEIQKAKHLHTSELNKYIADIQTNMYAYSKRRQQVEEFFTINPMDKLQFEHSLNYTRITLRSNMKFMQSRHDVELEFIYNPEQILPVVINKIVKPNIPTRFMDNFIEKLKVFDSLEFRAAYEQAIVKSTLFSFL